MFTRPRHPHDPIPSISAIPKPDDLPNWYSSPPDNLIRPDPSACPFPPPPPPPSLVHNNHPRIPPPIPKSHRTPHLPAEKNSALRAAKIAAESQDLGPDTCQRFKCHFQGCNKYFQRRYNLKVHVRKHTKETPYTCAHPGCGKKFMWRSSISHHLKAHKKRSKLLSQSTTTATATATASPRDSVSTADYTPHGDFLPATKGEDRTRRVQGGGLLPTSPISSENDERFGAFGLEHVGLTGSGDIGMDELHFHGAHVAGMMFDNMM